MCAPVNLKVATPEVATVRFQNFLQRRGMTMRKLLNRAPKAQSNRVQTAKQLHENLRRMLQPDDPNAPHSNKWGNRAFSKRYNADQVPLDFVTCAGWKTVEQKAFQKTGMGITLDGAGDDKISPQGAGDYALNDDPQATQIDGAHMDGVVGSDDDNMDEEDAMTDDANDEVLELGSSSSSFWNLDVVFNDDGMILDSEED